MNKNMAVRFTACAAFVFAASETLTAAELTHRWSFNGDYSDSAGGSVKGSDLIATVNYHSSGSL